MSTIRFGLVPVETVRQALGTETQFKITHPDGQQSDCILSGPFKQWKGLDAEDLQDIVADTPTLDKTRPFDAYMLGFRFFNNANKAYAQEPSHGIILVQDNQVHNLDLMA